MNSVVDRLIARDDVALTTPAPKALVENLSGRFGGNLPPSLLKLWGISDGIALESVDAHILGPTEVIQLIDQGSWYEEYLAQGLLPLLDDHQCNYIAVAAHGLLASRVLHVPHDDGCCILYRDGDSFFHALLGAMDQDEWPSSYFYNTMGDYPADAPRTLADQAAARALMATDGEHFEWNYAVQLLDASNLAEWAKLLETDHFVRREVLERMGKMSDPSIRELFERDRATYEDFAGRVIEAARAAGFDAKLYHRYCLDINESHMNFDYFFCRRGIPQAIPRMIAWFEDKIAGRNPKDRPGHFMED